jgi:hypothetical protein
MADDQALSRENRRQKSLPSRFVKLKSRRSVTGARGRVHVPHQSRADLRPDGFGRHAAQDRDDRHYRGGETEAPCRNNSARRALVTVGFREPLRRPFLMERRSCFCVPMRRGAPRFNFGMPLSIKDALIHCSASYTSTTTVRARQGGVTEAADTGGERV